MTLKSKWMPLIGFCLLAVLATSLGANAAANAFNFTPTALAANTGPSNPASGAVVVNGASLNAGDVVVFDALVVNVNGTQNDNWAAVNLNQGGYYGVTGATLGMLVRSGNVSGSTLYVNGVAENFTGSTAAVTNRVRMELYVSATGSTTNLGYRAFIDVGATGNAATTFTQTGTNLTFAGNSIALTFSAYTVSESFVENVPLSGVSVNPPNLTVLTNVSATFAATVTNAERIKMQWRKNGVFIANATNVIYVTPPAAATDNGALFDLVITNSFTPGNVITSSPALLMVRTNGPGLAPLSFSFTSLAAGSASAVPANGAVSLGGSRLLAGDEVFFDGTIINTTQSSGDNWAAVNLNSGGFMGVTGANLGVLLRTGNAAGYSCNLYTDGSGPLNFPGSGECNSNRVVIHLYVSANGSTTNVGYLVQLDQGLTGAFTSSLSGTNLTFSSNTINLTFSAYEAGESFVQNLSLTGVHLQLPDTNLLAGAAEQSSVTVDTGAASNSPPTYNPDFGYASSDNSVVTISSNGLLQAVGNGSAIVTVLLGNLSDSRVVNVTNVSGPLLDVRLLVATHMPLFATQQAAVRGDFANVYDVDLLSCASPAFMVANSNLLAVSPSGQISAIGPGTTFVTASYGGLSISKLVTVAFPTNRFIFDSYGDGFWAVTNAGNGLLLTANSFGASQESYINGAADQQFQLLYDLQNSTYHIRQRSTWQCLGLANGTGVATVANYTGLTLQQWYLVDAGNGNFRIVNAATGLAMQTDNENPASVTLQPVSTNLSQLWNFSYQTHYPKKGCAGYEEDYAQFGLNWAYNYDDHPSTNLPPGVNYVPMIYAAQYWEPLSDAQSRDAAWLSEAQPDYLLTYNEPDNTGAGGGSNTSTNDALGAWPLIEALNLPLVSPAVQNTFDAWQYSFFSSIASNHYRVDYTAVHEYVPPNASSLLGLLYSVYTTFGHPVWLTEFSPVDWGGNAGWTEDDDYNFLAEFLWMAEGDEWLKRYSIFPFSGTNPNPPYASVTAGYRGNFFETDGTTLTPYGELYSAWDGKTNLQTRTPYFIHNLGTSLRLTSTNLHASPQPATIYTRDPSAQWALLPSPTTNQYYIISLNDGRRLSNNGGTPGLAPFGATGSSVQWAMNGPDGKGYYYLDNVSGSQSLGAGGSAPAITFSMANNPAQSAATQWRLVKPYAPGNVLTASPPGVAVSYSSQAATLGWVGNGVFYNIYRSLTSGAGYVKVASFFTNSTYSDGPLQNGTAYYYVVTSLNILGEESVYSAEVIARPASTVQQPIGFGLAGNGAQSGIQFNWPADHIGWRLTMSTNGLANPNWVTVPGSAATNQIWLPFDSSANADFFRLVYP